MSNITGQKGTRQLEMAAKGCPAETPWCHLCAKICAHTPRPGTHHIIIMMVTTMMMVMVTTMMMMVTVMVMKDCVGQVVFIKSHPLSNLASLTYPPSHCDICNLVFILTSSPDERGPNPDLGEPVHGRRQLSHSKLHSRGRKEFRGFAKGIF